MYTTIQQINESEKNYELDIISATDEISHPNDWIIYKTKDNKYKLGIDYLSIKSFCAWYGMSYNILSSSDLIILETTDDKSVCDVITDRYKYKFKQSDTLYNITNNTTGSYKYKKIELVSIEKNIDNLKKLNTEDKYYLELDEYILNLYIDGEYKWSKVISTKYTKGIYFVLGDKIFTVIDNGYSMLDIFNLDGSLHKQIKTSMEYIETFEIIYEDSKPKILKLNGFMWHPIYMNQYILIETIFMDKMKKITYDEYDIGYKDHTFSEDEFTNPIQGCIDDSDFEDTTTYSDLKEV